MTHVMQWFAILMTRLKDIIIKGNIPISNPSWFNRPYNMFRKNKTRNWYDGPMLEAIPSFPKRLDRKMFVELR